jgi:hypothetical protein
MGGLATGHARIASLGRTNINTKKACKTQAFSSSGGGI